MIMAENNKKYPIMRDNYTVPEKPGMKTARSRRKQTTVTGNYMGYIAAGPPTGKYKNNGPIIMINCMDPV